MIIDVKPVNLGAMDCFESIFASVLEWKKIHHELLWINSIGFDFLIESNNTSGIIGDKITAGKDFNEYTRFAEKYLNIYCTQHLREDPDEDLNMVKNELSDGRPVLLLLDPFWVSWNKEAYGIHHYLPGHSSLAVGIDNCMIHCIDTVPKVITDAILPVSDFKQGCNAYFTFNFVNSKPSELLLDDLLDRILCNLSYSSAYTDSFYAIREFGKCVNTSLDISSETEGFNELTLWLAPLINNTDKILRSYGKFLMLMKFINTQYHVNIPSKVQELIERGELVWNLVLGLFTKAYFSPDKAGRAITRASIKINEAADIAEEIYNELLKFKNNIYTSISPSPITHGGDRPLKHNSIKDVTFIDLNDHFNNKGFGRGISPACNSDLTGFGYYLLSDGIPEDDIWVVSEIKYKLPNLFSDNNDNISCDNQVIEISPGYYTGIAILGCAEARNQGGFLIVNYSDGSTEEIVIKFTDWCAKPLFGETVAWSGLRVSKNEGNAIICEEKASLFAQHYVIHQNKAIIQIVLPDCWNLHIFAISLYK